MRGAEYQRCDTEYDTDDSTHNAAPAVDSRRQARRGLEADATALSDGADDDDRLYRSETSDANAPI
jgi:hypothetical protein